MFDFSAVLKGPKKSVPPRKEQTVKAGERSGLNFDRHLRLVSTLGQISQCPTFLAHR